MPTFEWQGHRSARGLKPEKRLPLLPRESRLNTSRLPLLPRLATIR
jgi:hypothetical protein